MRPMTDEERELDKDRNQAVNCIDRLHAGALAGLKAQAALEAEGREDEQLSIAEEIDEFVESAEEIREQLERGLRQARSDAVECRRQGELLPNGHAQNGLRRAAAAIEGLARIVEQLV